MAQTSVLKRVALGAAALAVALLALLLFMPPLLGHLPVSGARVAVGRLREIVRAEEAFSSISSAGKERRYWRVDLAQLHTGIGPESPAERLDLALALADDRPGIDLSRFGKRAPLQGYWFRSIRREEETVPDPAHFAFCAFPATYRTSGRHTLLASDSGAIWAKDLGSAGGIEFFPKDPVRSGWRKIE
jgi:hypothetical protein